MIRAVLDTNILISGLVFGGKPAAILDQVAAGRISLYISPALADEFRRVLELKFKGHLNSISDTLAELSDMWHLVYPPKFNRTFIKADPDDDRVLECALYCKADCVVSGDKHLLNLRQFKEIPILTPHEFLSGFDA